MRTTTLLICSGAVLFVGVGVRSDEPNKEQRQKALVALTKLDPVIKPSASHKPSQTKPRQSVSQHKPKVTPKPKPKPPKPKVTPKPKPKPEPNPNQFKPKVTPKPKPNPKPSPNKPRPPRVNPSDRKHQPAPDRSHTQRRKPDPRLRPHLPPKPKINDSHPRRHQSDRLHRDDRRHRSDRHRWRHHPRHRVIIFGTDSGGGGDGGGGGARRSRESWDDDGGDDGARSSREGRDDGGVRRSADSEGEKSKTSDADQAVTAAKQTQRLLRLVNGTDRSLRVSVQYRTLLGNGSYAWLPAHPADSREAVTFLIAAGKTLDLARDGTPIAASRVRLWVQSTGGSWTDYRDKDLWLVPEVDEGGEHYYRAAEMEAYTLTLGGKAE